MSISSSKIKFKIQKAISKGNLKSQVEKSIIKNNINFRQSVILSAVEGALSKSKLKKSAF